MEKNDAEAETQTTITQGPSGHSQILHVRQDSATELDLLFNAVMNPNFKSKSLPMKLRKLPKSFFQQPDRPRHPAMHSHSRSMGGLVSTAINHSRSSSTDSSTSHTSGLNLSSNNIPQQCTVQGGSGVVQRPGNFSSGDAQHHRFNSPGHVGSQAPQIFHSRSKSSPASLQILNANLQLKVAQQGDSCGIEIPLDMPLPQGWEVAKTADGQTYYMNHTNRTTTWVDPRVTIIKERQQHDHANANCLSSTSSRLAPPAGLHGNNKNEAVLQQPLPPGWEQAATPQGEVYFINHETRTTSWLDPRLQSIALTGGQGQMSVQMQHQLNKQRNISEPQMMLKRLAKEKELMMMRQRDMLKQQVTSGMDPFLGSPTSYQEHDAGHSSGSGGMTGNFTLAHGNDDFLGGVEEMETDGSNHAHQSLNQQRRCMANVQQPTAQQVQPTGRSSTQQRQFPDFLDSLPASSVDYNADVTNQTSNALEGEELVTSISETLSPDFINDVESMLNPVVKSENMDSMTWL